MASPQRDNEECLLIQEQSEDGSAIQIGNLNSQLSSNEEVTIGAGEHEDQSPGGNSSSLERRSSSPLSGYTAGSDESDVADQNQHEKANPECENRSRCSNNII